MNEPNAKIPSEQNCAKLWENILHYFTGGKEAMEIVFYSIVVPRTYVFSYYVPSLRAGIFPAGNNLYVVPNK